LIDVLPLNHPTAFIGDGLWLISRSWSPLPAVIEWSFTDRASSGCRPFLPPGSCPVQVNLDGIEQRKDPTDRQVACPNRPKSLPTQCWFAGKTNA
jgi:hypothetical protein